LGPFSNYLRTRLSEAFKDIEDEFVQNSTNIANNNSRYQKGGADYFFSARCKVDDHPAYLEQMLSRGLPFLQRVLSSSGAERRKLILQHARRTPFPLTDALIQNQPSYEISHGGRHTYGFWRRRILEGHRGNDPILSHNSACRWYKQYLLDDFNTRTEEESGVRREARIHLQST
jgi:hypothetical protein